MIKDAIDRLDYLCNIIPTLLIGIDDHTFNEKPSPDKWSKKEIIGHLIDSATNNHQRFVRGQYEDKPQIAYDQNKWNRYNFYHEINSRQLIDFWTVYNKQLLELIKRIPTENLLLECFIGENLYTISFLIHDYVEHLEHHLNQVVVF